MSDALPNHTPVAESASFELTGNPIFRDNWTADPAPLVVGDSLYVYVGHDEADSDQMFNMKEWLVYSTKDMKHWTAHGPVMKPTDFRWAVGDAWAAQAVEKDGKFYFYTTVQHDPSHNGKAIGVAVSDRPTGPFEDARGSALVTDGDTPGPFGWDDIDPTVLIDDDGTAWMSWGNPNCYLAKLKPNMIELDGPIQKIHVPNYTEGPWLHKQNGLYYLFYAAFAHQAMWEKISYATAKNITGPWTYQGILTGSAKNSYTIHPGVVEFKGQAYLFYHNATLEINGIGGAVGRRSVTAEYLFFNPDGTIQPITQTEEGISVPPQRTHSPVSESPDWAKSDKGVEVTQSIEADPESWPGNPGWNTVDSPYWQATRAVSFNAQEHPSSLGQTFKLERGLKLQRVVLYAGDGMGATRDEPVTLALYDLGTGDSSPESYPKARNLIGGEDGLNMAYRPQARGLLQIDFAASVQVVLKAGHVYAFELRGKAGSAPLFWRRSDKDHYVNGAAYANRNRIKDGESSSDFAIALYGLGL